MDTLSGRLLSAEAAAVDKLVAEELIGVICRRYLFVCYCVQASGNIQSDCVASCMYAAATLLTYSVDGWSTRRMESVFAHMIITELRAAHFMTSEDVSSERHTGEKIAGEAWAMSCARI